MATVRPRKRSLPRELRLVFRGAVVCGRKRALVFTEEHACGLFKGDAADVRQADGSLVHVAGDFLDPTVCPGPFDVVISRCTIQHYRGEALPAALAALVRRVADPGLLVIHCHNAHDVDRELPGLLHAHGFVVKRIDPSERARSTAFSPRIAGLLATSG